VVLLLRALLPAFKDKNLKSLLFVVVLATVSIGLLYAAGFMWGKNTNLSIMEYWRWWVVHLWVEGVLIVVKITMVVATEVLNNPIRTNKTEIIAVANTSNTPSTQR
jgi:nitric oxide reductase subunit B